MDMIMKNVKHVELNTKILSARCPEYTNVKDGLIECKCLCCNKNQFINKYKFSNHDINKSILLLQKVSMHMNTLIGKNLMKRHYLRKKAFTIRETWKILLMQITSIRKEFVKFLKLRVLILLLGDVFNNFGNMGLEIYGLDPAHFLSAPGLGWQAVLNLNIVSNQC